MSGAAPPAPPSSPACLASESERCRAWYFRYSPPTAKLTGFLAQSCRGVSPLIVARACESSDLTWVLAAWLMNEAIAGVIVPGPPNILSGTQLLVVVKQVVVLVASNPWRTRDS